ncbi:MAG: hypothetical protein IPK15_13400 [Verrucomicrobia bacterium]|nr:hypothetical protein [Verrucomicrobiota bacterium]
MLSAGHSMDGALHREQAFGEQFERRRPDHHGELKGQGQQEPFGQAVDALSLLIARDHEAFVMLAGQLLDDAILLALFPGDDLFHGQALDARGDVVVAEPELGQLVNQRGIGVPRPAPELHDAVVVAIEVEAVPPLAAQLAVPAVLKHGPAGIRRTRRIVFRPVEQ